jgi:hypothetical protein
MPTAPNSTTTIAAAFAAIARDPAVVAAFGDITTSDSLLSCAAKAAAEPAFYRLFIDNDTVYVALVTDNRWLSQSIEQDLMHTGDKLPDLLEEELANLDMPGIRPAVEHFRDQAKLFTFRSKILPAADLATNPTAINTCRTFLLAYDACFQNLGDMTAGDDDE